MNTIEVNKFSIELLDECVDLYMKTYSQEPWNESWESKDVIKTFMLNHYGNNYFLGYVAMRNGRVVGLSLGFKKPWICGMEYYIDDFFVDVDCHRQGIGSKFMDEIKKDLLSQGMHAIILNTERGFPSQSFYEKIGFKIEENMIILDISF